MEGLNGFKENVVHKKIHYFNTACDIPEVCICPVHWHEAIEIILVYEGSVVYTIGDKKYVLEKGDIAIASFCALHAIDNTASSKYYALVVNLDDFISPATTVEFAALKQADLMQALDEKYKSRILEKVWKIIDVYENKEAVNNLDLCSYVYGLMSDMYMATLWQEKRQGDDPLQELVRRTIDYMTQHYGEPMTVEAIAKKFGISKYYYIRAFKQYTGCTPNKFLNSIKINKAQSLLSEGKSVKNVAALCGFNSTNYFSEYFKQVTNMTPTEYIQHTAANGG